MLQKWLEAAVNAIEYSYFVSFFDRKALQKERSD